jgi:hypothetical protein
MKEEINRIEVSVDEMEGIIEKESGVWNEEDKMNMREWIV